uniref:Uncharacterized protein n=1 Tax=Cacopsylla melanoneura TaxID=428564 RepID=A0A8D8QWC1_9HEMI
MRLALQILFRLEMCTVYLPLTSSLKYNTSLKKSGVNITRLSLSYYVLVIMARFENHLGAVRLLFVQKHEHMDRSIPFQPILHYFIYRIWKVKQVKQCQW